MEERGMTLDVSKYGKSTFWSDYQTALRNGNAKLVKQYEQIISDPANAQSNQDFRQALVREGMIRSDAERLLPQTTVDQYILGVSTNTSVGASETGSVVGVSRIDQAARLAWHNHTKSGNKGHIFDQALPTDQNGAPIAALQTALGGAATARAENISTSVLNDVLLTLGCRNEQA